MATIINRSLSLVVALAYLAAGYTHGGGATLLRVAIFLLLPMGCIWFSDAMGQYDGTVRGQAMTSSTPPFLVCAGGWFILVGAPILGYFLSKGL